MPMTMTQKILAYGAGLSEVKAGDFVMAKLDMVLGNDITTPVAVNEFDKMGVEEVFDSEKVSVVMDHFVPAKDIKSAQMAKECKEFCTAYDIKHFYEVGRAGVEHALLPELGIVKAGDVIIGADSHTCTFGALGAFATGIGSTDMAAGMAKGKAWFRVPEAIDVVLTGELNEYVTGKDVILHLIGLIGVDGATYRSLEFSGPGVGALTIDDRFTIANMAIEAGAKNGIFPVDQQTRDYMIEAGVKEGSWREFSRDEDAEYVQTVEINLSELEPTIAFPHLPENARTLSSVDEEIRIDQVVIGSCTNGRLVDMRQAAEILKGREVAENMKCIIIPATQKIFKECMQEGLAEIFIDAGCVFSTPTCGPCLGGYMGILAENEKCVSTTNRNFVGRMGHHTAEVYLASPYIAAASAVAGVLCGPEDLE